MKLEVLLKTIRPSSVAGARDAEITAVACDSRHVGPGTLFVAIPGSHKDGWSYAEDAVQRGAVAVVAEREGRPGRRDVCVIQVPDAREAVARLACAFHGDPSHALKLVGITGTNGKTTTAYMIRNIFRAHGWKPGLLSTVEYEIGERSIPATRTTPDAPTLQSYLAQIRNAGCLSAVMEVSSHALSQKRTAGTEFDAAVFTNLTRDHLDYHVTLEDYFESKALLFSGLKDQAKPAAAILNTDDPAGPRLLERLPPGTLTVTYGTGPAAAVRAASIALSRQGCTAELQTPWGRDTLRLRLMGRFNVSNALAALATAGALGIPLATSLAALADMAPVAGRLEEVPTGRDFQVFVDYAHTDDALENVLTTLREITAGRLILVFGCGGMRDRTKRPLMGKVAARLADYSIITSDNPRKETPADIIADIRPGFDGSSAFETLEDRAKAIEKALALAGKGDVVLIAGKGHEYYQEFANTTVPFDDRQVARRCLDART